MVISWFTMRKIKQSFKKMEVGERFIVKNNKVRIKIALTGLGEQFFWIHELSPDHKCWMYTKYQLNSIGNYERIMGGKYPASFTD